MIPGLPVGADRRLLPEWLPLFFFALAVTALPLAWLVLGFGGDELFLFKGGPGPVLTALHLFTVGVLMAVAFGAALQMLPVATAGRTPATGLCLTVLAGLGCGGATLLIGFWTAAPLALWLGLFVLGLGVAVYAATLVRLAVTSRVMRDVMVHVGLAMFCLLSAWAFAGGRIAAWLGASWLEGAMPLFIEVGGLLHAGLAVYGFMGFLVLGLSRILLPMLLMAQPKPLGTDRFILPLAAAALAVWAFGTGMDAAVWRMVGLTLGLAASGLHLRWALGVLKARMRPRLGNEFLLIRVAWVMLPISLLVALGFEGGVLPPHLAGLGLMMAVLGWLVTFALGILQRIVPFLLSMQIARRTGIPEMPSTFVHEQALRAHAWLHLAACLCLVVAFVFANVPLLTVGAGVGFLSGLAFAAFFIHALSVRHRCVRAGRASFVKEQESS